MSEGSHGYHSTEWRLLDAVAAEEMCDFADGAEIADKPMSSRGPARTIRVALTSRASPAFGWLLRPAVRLAKPEYRRAHLLAWLLLLVLILELAALLLVLITDPVRDPRRVVYIVLILGLVALALLAYGLNWSGHYAVSAGMTVALAVIGPWGSAMLDPTVSHGDFVPLVYVVLPVMLSSVLLSPSVTGALAVLQLCALALVPRYVPATASINWASLISFVAFTSALSVTADVVSRRDLAQIDEQTRQLAASEARLQALSVRDPLTGLFNRRIASLGVV